MSSDLNPAPKIMGIINLTPDSFYSESRVGSNGATSPDKYDKADIIDIGCESSRPGASPISEKEELNRLSQFLDLIPNFKQQLSIDTYKPNVARFGLKNGFAMINDINGGGNNGEMFVVAAEFKCPIIIMHMKGNPANMQDNPKYDNIIDELLGYFEEQIISAKQIGLSDDQIILDPGVGFGKRVCDNDSIINNISQLKAFGYPVLIGLSRKSFLSIDEDTPDDRLAATLGVTVLAIENGADIIRVHDVYDTFKMITIINRICKNKTNEIEYQ